MATNDDPRQARIEGLYRELLEALGYAQDDPHLADTPRRMARFAIEWHRNQAKPPPLTTFRNSNLYDEIVLIDGIAFHSLCAHHGLPFFGTAAVAYIPSGKIVGLSKIARTVEHFARRLQVQERLTQDIAKHLERELEPVGLAVVLSASHLCIGMRGVEQPTNKTKTSDMRGVFRTKPEARAEVLALLKE